jgi:prepilin-type N-terminal cleavage/methylation domain-containing protein
VSAASTAQRVRSGAGFTLVELLVAIALGTVLAGAITAFLITGLTAADSRQSQARAQDGMRQAVENFTRDARQAVSPDGVTPPIISLSPTAVELYVDTSRVASTAAPQPEKVRYSLSGTQLVRQEAPISGSYGTAMVLAQPVANGPTPIFAATDLEGLATTTLRDVATLSMDLIVGQKIGRSSSTTELTADVALRNVLQ